MRLLYLAAIATLCVATVTVSAQESVHTPKPGSTERQAICDAARAFVLGKYATATLPQAIVFKVEHLSVQDNYCNFEAIPLFKDGSYISAAYIVDIAFNFCLKKAGGGWRVIADLSRTDVPAVDEIAAIRRMLPPDFPLALLSPTWRNLLRNASGDR